jgi:hypothetical protein
MEIKIKVYKSEIDELLDDYLMMFDDTFPSWQLGLDKDIIKECLRQGKTAYELGYLDDNEDIIY